MGRRWLRPTMVWLVLLLTFTSPVAETALAAAAAPAISLYVDGSNVQADAAPELRDGRVFVPLRAVATALGAQVGWNPERQEATVTLAGTVLQLRVGQREATLNGRPYMADPTPVISGGRTLVPLRLVAEALGASVAWEAASTTVRISLGGQAGAAKSGAADADAATAAPAAAPAGKPDGPAAPSWAGEVPGPLSPPPGPPRPPLLPPPPDPPGPPPPPAALTLTERGLQEFQDVYPGTHVPSLVSKMYLRGWVPIRYGDPVEVGAQLVCYAGSKPQTVAILWGSRWGYEVNVGDSSGNPLFHEMKPESELITFSNQRQYLPIPDYLTSPHILNLPSALVTQGPAVPPGCSIARRLIDLADRQVLDAVIQNVPYDADAAMQADTAAWETGKPTRIYLRVDAQPEWPVCPLRIVVSVPDWFRVVEAQGADISRDTWSTTVGADDAVRGPRAPTLSASPHQLSMGVHNLIWKTRLENGKPFERWIDVIPGTPPPGINIESVGVILRGIAFHDPKEAISAWGMSRGFWNKQVHLPLGGRLAPAKARLAANVSRRTHGIYDIDFTVHPGTLAFLDQKLAVWAADAGGNLTPIMVVTENGKPANNLWPNPAFSKTFKMSVRTPGAWGTVGFLLPAGTTKVVAELRGMTTAGTYHSEERLEVPLAGERASVEAEMTLRRDKEPLPSQLPPVRQPADNVQPGECLTGAGSQPDQAFINLSVKPPFLSEKRQNRATVEATYVGPGKDALPLSLHVSAPGELSDVKESGNRVTATLSASDIKSGALIVSATAADGTAAFASVPVGGDAVLDGRVAYRSGNLDDESPVQRAHVRVDAQWDKLAYVPEVYSDSRGQYSAVVEADKQMTVAVDHADYAPAAFTMPPTAPDDEGVIHAPAPVYLVKMDTLAAVRRRLELVRRWHNDLKKGSALLTQADLEILALAGLQPGGLAPSEVPDPTVADGVLAKYLDRVEAGTTGEAQVEEALRRLDLALELETYADPETKRFAQQVTTKLWDGGLALLTSLWTQASQALQLLQGQAVNAKVIDLLDVQELDAKFRKDLNYIEDTMWTLLSFALSDQGADAEKVVKQQAFAKKLLGWLKSKLREKLALKWDEVAPYINEQAGGVGLERGSGAETAIKNWIKGGYMEVIKGELTALLAGYLASGYLDMVNEELTEATLRGQAGRFSMGGIEVARDLVHRDIRDLQFLATINMESVATEEFRTFVEGMVKDYQGWGEWALLGVTAGGAAPVVASVDKVIPLVQGLVAGRKFVDAAKMYLSILYPDGDWWTAVKKGIRDAFDARAVRVTGP